MMKRRIGYLLLVIALAMSLLGGCGSATPAASDTSTDQSGNAVSDTEVYELRMVHQHPDTTQQGRNALKFKELVEKYTNGRVNVTIYGAAQLGAADKEPQMVKTGIVEMMSTYNGTIIPLVPEEQIYDIPFLFDVEPGDDSIVRAVQGNELINEKISAGAEKAGFKTLGNVPTCFGVFACANNKRAVDAPEDAKGLKIRLATSDMLKIIIDEMDASPVSITPSEVAVGLSQGVFDGLVTTLAYYHEAKWHTKYMTTNFLTAGSYPYYVNLAWWNKLPADLQDTIENVVMPELLEYAYTTSAEAEVSAVEAMQQAPYNVEVTRWDLNDPNIKQFIDITQQKGIDLFVSKLGDEGQAMVDEVLKIRDELK